MAQRPSASRRAATRHATRALQDLEALRETFTPEAAVEKIRLLGQLEVAVLATAAQVLRLHEALCFSRAYPDNPRVLRTVERLLRRFGEREDLQGHRDELTDSGISGTSAFYAFYYVTAKWLARRWGKYLSIDWEWFDAEDRLEKLLPILLPYSESLTLDEGSLGLRELVDTLRGPEETDAAFLVRRFAALPGAEFTREAVFEDLDPKFRLDPGPTTPSRSRARYPRPEIVFQTGPLRSARPDLKEELRRPPLSVTPVGLREGRRLVDLAREAMVTRARDLDIFAFADARDVAIVDCGDGLEFACMGGLPERRLLLESVYGFITMKNGIPIGYVLSGALFRSAGVAYNVFETNRGGEAGMIYGRVLSMLRHLFGADSFHVDPYQLGHDNAEGLRSGAWWFYYKLGFRPEDPDVVRLMNRELERMRRNSRYRSSEETLQDLSAANVYLDTGRPRTRTLGRFALGELGTAISRNLAARFGADREKGERVCMAEAAERLGVHSMSDFTPGERLAWRRWAPLVAVIPGLDRWSPTERRALAEIIRAKGGQRELEFVRRFDAHPRLGAALGKLAANS